MNEFKCETKEASSSAVTVDFGLQHLGSITENKIRVWDGCDVAQDAVNSPSHYASGGIECIEAIKASMTPEAFKGYLKGNVQKYMWRYEKKVNAAEDLKKARWYLDKLIEEVEL